MSKSVILIYSFYTFRYSGHKDGVWDVCYCSWLKGKAIIGTASNDKTARIWQADGKNCLLKYLGHSGSVNSIRLVSGFTASPMRLLS